MLDDEKSSTEDIVQAFEQVELEIFKLLAYDPFLRFKRQAIAKKSIVVESMCAGRPHDAQDQISGTLARLASTLA